MNIRTSIRLAVIPAMLSTATTDSGFQMEFHESRLIKLTSNDLAKLRKEVIAKRTRNDRRKHK